jgi:hypothetical protein
MHPDEPSLKELERRRNKLYGATSTDENMKRLCAINRQIVRRRKEVLTVRVEE